GGDRAYFPVRNTDRAVGARLSGLIAQRHGNQGMTGNPITVELSGTAGQSFGVWNAGGLHLLLTGDANDYVGKGMAGGLLVIKPPAGVSYRSHESVIIGNTCLYGATGGRLFAAGRAGERFAVRNSGARAVVEGIGDNGCEYMTGGVVTILGETGINFAAGMTGGFAYVLDEFDRFDLRVNRELVDVLSMGEMPDLTEHLHIIISAHLSETGSRRAEQILNEFGRFINRFRLVKPKGLRVEELLGKRGRSATELLMTTQ
ncbi:MAG: glutamate synthase large subunit, partial [Desulfofustis sp.]|nr:glutamate synthase large subunit [Desulfofustis sp.]